MTPDHHVPDELLLEYVTGAASEPADLAVACHITMCAACAAREKSLEAMAGALLVSGPAAELPDRALEAVLGRLDEPPPAGDQPRAPLIAPPLLAPLQLPQPLLACLTGGAATASARVASAATTTTAGAAAPAWRFLVPGVRVIDLDVGSAAPDAVARLVAFKGGVKIPPHDHGGPEYIVVFAGALEEKDGRFGRGDISVRAPGERHEQRAVPGATCVSLVINEGRLLPLTLRGRLLLALAGG
jgi:putative transcriptional regulator